MQRERLRAQIVLEVLELSGIGLCSGEYHKNFNADPDRVTQAFHKLEQQGAVENDDGLWVITDSGREKVANRSTSVYSD